ncbi:N-acetylmuramoyl-L-alanine amidase [Flavihumibacter profundi]|uniref:N-acetylmuramoyl-L-alanine amidase n=1 Tax=Flavihumibacter profundi TaxID=2716883 RepID=UPI001CC38E97|nr:N-acetylmuramoyl-L-alanine amidase [Flavihumibacter profundi]MBZ5857965.1 N-acetylmuramoyl-L-alanine amidase [Flavihumibacter profundi]
MKVFSAYTLLLIGAATIFACSRQPFAKTNKAQKKQVKSFTRKLRQFPPDNSLDNGEYWVGTTNFSMRKPNYVVIHHTAQDSCGQTLKTFTTPRTQVSAHYVICKDGTIHQMLNDYLRAHHAGVAKWGNATDLNSSSIGIELDNNGFEDFDPRQLNSLYRLLDTLKQRYNIPAANFVGHGDIAPTRKNDPNWRFPWKDLADRGFGTWYKDTSMLQVPNGFDHLIALRLVGYDVKDSTAAILAFKRHWLQDTTAVMTPVAEKILFGLISQ